VCTADLKPPAVDNCSALPVKQTVPGTAGDITPGQMAWRVLQKDTEMRRKRERNEKEEVTEWVGGWMDG